MANKITTTVSLDLSIVDAARWFASLSDDEQAQFLIEVGKIAGNNIVDSPSSYVEIDH